MQMIILRIKIWSNDNSFNMVAKTEDIQMRVYI